MRASSRALLHIGLLSLWDRQPSNAPPLLLSPAGLASRRGPHTKTHLGLCPKTPLPLSCGWIRSQGACSAFCSGFSRDQIKNQPYKRRLIPHREAVLWLSGRGVPSRRGSRGTPRVTFAYFSSEKSRPPPARRTGCYPVVTMRRRRRLQAGSKYLLLLFLGEKQARGSVYNLRLA